MAVLGHYATESEWVSEYRTHAHECAPAGRPTDRPPDAITGGEDVCAFYYEDKKWSDRRTFISLSVDSPMSIIRPTAAHAQISKVPRVQIAIGASTAAPLKMRCEFGHEKTKQPRLYIWADFFSSEMQLFTIRFNGGQIMIIDTGLKIQKNKFKKGLETLKLY